MASFTRASDVIYDSEDDDHLVSSPSDESIKFALSSVASKTKNASLIIFCENIRDIFHTSFDSHKLDTSAAPSNSIIRNDCGKSAFAKIYTDSRNNITVHVTRKVADELCTVFVRTLLDAYEPAFVCCIGADTNAAVLSITESSTVSRSGLRILSTETNTSSASTQNSCFAEVPRVPVGVVYTGIPAAVINCCTVRNIPATSVFCDRNSTAGLNNLSKIVKAVENGENSNGSQTEAVSSDEKNQTKMVAGGGLLPMGNLYI